MLFLLARTEARFHDQTLAAGIENTCCQFRILFLLFCLVNVRVRVRLSSAVLSAHVLAFHGRANPCARRQGDELRGHSYEHACLTLYPPATNQGEDNLSQPCSLFLCLPHEGTNLVTSMSDCFYCLSLFLICCLLCILFV